MPEISVIVPVYKVEQYLNSCVDSILAQTFTDFELILIDDGSPDSCGDICDKYQKSDNRVRVVHQENGGLSAARNAGMDIAVGQFITFIDSDDLVPGDYLNTLYMLCKEQHADIAVCGFTEFEHDTEIKEAKKRKNLFVHNNLDGKNGCCVLYRGSADMPINAWGKLYRASLVSDLRFPEGRLHEDQAFVPIACYRAKRICLTGRNMYMYRVQSNSITHKPFSVKRYDDLWALDYCIDFFQSVNEFEIVEEAKRRRSIIQAKYAIMAYHDKVKVPQQYAMSIRQALKQLRGNVTDEKYEYFLGLVNLKYVRLYRYVNKIRDIVGLK